MDEELSLPWEKQLSFAELVEEPTKLREVLNAGKNVNARDFEHGRTFSSWAAEKGNESAVDILLNVNADANEADSGDCRTPLFHAVANGHEAVAKRLLEAGGQVDTPDIFGKTPLILAVRKGYGSLVKTLLEAGAGPDTCDSRYGRPPLSWAAKRGHEDIFKSLLDSNAAVDLKDELDRTPIAWAAMEGHENMVRLLLERHANTAIEDIEFGRTPLAWAIAHGHDSIVRILIEKRGQDNGWNSAAVAAASTLGAANHLQMLMTDAKSDECFVDSQGRTLLMLAAMNGCKEQVKMLLRQGADPNLQDEDGRTALSLAAEKCLADMVEASLKEDDNTDSADDYSILPENAKIARLLIENKADIDVRDNEGRTPLSYAAGAGNEAVVSLLLGKGADLGSRDEQRWTSLLCAAERGHAAVVSLLLEKGADPNVRDEDGWTPLLSAADSGDEEVVSLLLEKGANPNCQDDEGRTAVELATEGGHVAVVRLLLANKSFNASEIGYQALMNAISNEDITLVTLLVDKGADPYYFREASPLTFAAELGYEEMVALFLRAEAESSKAKMLVRAALVFAIKEGHHNIIELLLGKYPFDVKAGETLHSIAEEVSGMHDSGDTVRLLRPYFPAD